LAKKEQTSIPGRAHPDPHNVRQRPFQGGADGLASPPTQQHTYGDYRGKDVAFADRRMPPNLGAGLSGLPEANAGSVEPLYNSPEAPSPRPRSEGKRPEAE
jgi:hypothetical protein